MDLPPGAILTKLDLNEEVEDGEHCSLNCEDVNLAVSLDGSAFRRAEAGELASIISEYQCSCSWRMKYMVPTLPAQIFNRLVHPNRHIASQDCGLGFPSFIDAGYEGITPGIFFHENVWSRIQAKGGGYLVEQKGGKGKVIVGMLLWGRCVSRY